MIDEIIKKNFYKISDQYRKFAVAKSKCQKCDMFKCYQTIVQSEGNAESPTFMICCEAPGSSEISLHRPLIGVAGQELRQTLRNFGFTKKNTILTNVMPCRPLDNKFPDNWELVSGCYRKWLYNEIYILKPKIIITCGAKALKMAVEKTAVSLYRGQWTFIPHFQAWHLGTWHPSYVCRCKNDKNKQEVALQFRDDFKKVATEWIHIYNDRRLHMDNEQYKKNSINSIIKMFAND